MTACQPGFSFNSTEQKAKITQFQRKVLMHGEEEERPRGGTNRVGGGRPAGLPPSPFHSTFLCEEISLVGSWQELAEVDQVHKGPIVDA